MPDHDSAMQILREAGHRDTIEYIQTLESHNQPLQEELEHILLLLAELAAINHNQCSNVFDRAEAVLKYTREYLSHQH